MRNWRWRNVPLPEVHLAFLAAGLVLRFLVPWSLFPAPWIGHVFGWPLIVLGTSLAAWAVSEAADVDLERPAEIVVEGPYAFSRHPMYLAWDVIYVGIALVLNAAWPLIFLPVVLLVTHIVILREERQLEARFGEDYRRYRTRVRRYL